MSDHERIWLEASPGADNPTYDRQWCQDNVWGDEATEYVRADLYEAQLAGHRLSAKQSTENLIRATAAEATVTALQEKLRVAEEALEPYANFDTEDFPDAMRAFEDDPSLTIGHFAAHVQPFTRSGVRNENQANLRMVRPLGRRLHRPSQAQNLRLSCTVLWVLRGVESMTETERAIAIIEARLPLYTDIGQINALRECISSIRSAALSAGQAQPVAIKPLEWKYLDSPPVGEEYASNPIGTYFIQLFGFGKYPLSQFGNERGVYPTLDEAKAAAQSDYETRIRAALVGVGE